MMRIPAKTKQMTIRLPRDSKQGTTGTHRDSQQGIIEIPLVSKQVCEICLARMLRMFILATWSECFLGPRLIVSGLKKILHRELLELSHFLSFKAAFKARIVSQRGIPEGNPFWVQWQSCKGTDEKELT